MKDTANLRPAVNLRKNCCRYMKKRSINLSVNMNQYTGVNYSRDNLDLGYLFFFSFGSYLAHERFVLDVCVIRNITFILC
ncbi:hypothetical protein RRG08_017130 [Elysia crispata]|uniref:Uncharacterized protein n=1 Tax=Elysia crispata TaxID=231223 RepID=A0AAE1AEZ8_9GAST|nr:hypothetical protein RRG08_017130 [Elysia crispata]